MYVSGTYAIPNSLLCNCWHICNIRPSGAVGGVRFSSELILCHEMLRRYVSLNRGSLDDGAKIKEFLVGVGYEVIEVGRQLKRVDGLVIVRF